MRLREQKLWDTVKRNMPIQISLERMENIVVNGMPDVYGMAPCGVSFWVELKAPPLRARLATPVLGDKDGLNIDQINWHLKAASKQQRTYILIREDCQHGRLYLIEGRHAAVINRWAHDTFVRQGAKTTWRQIAERLSG